MVLRVIQFVLGVLLAGGGGYVAWSQRAGAANIFPPGPSGVPALLLLGILAVTAGLVFLVSALHPRPNQKRYAAEKAAREDAALTQAEAYYSERSRAADRDWRSADIAPLPPSVPAPAAPPPPVAAAPIIPAPPPPPPANPFPSPVALNPIPRPSRPPPPPSAPVATPPAADGPYGAIRAAITAGRLGEAEAMLNAARETAAGLELAQLTALAGDHAAASGQQSHAKWLWRLALKRFGENDAASSPEALRLTRMLKPPA